MKERCPEVLVPVHFRTGGHEDVLGKAKAAQAAMGALHAAGGPFVALGHNHHQIHVAVLVRRAPGMRAKQPDLLRLELRHQLLRRTVKQVLTQSFHASAIAQPVRRWKRELMALPVWEESGKRSASRRTSLRDRLWSNSSRIGPDGNRGVAFPVGRVGEAGADVLVGQAVIHNGAA